MNDRAELYKIIDELPDHKLVLAAAYLQGLVDGSTDTDDRKEAVQ